MLFEFILLCLRLPTPPPPRLNYHNLEQFWALRGPVILRAMLAVI